MSAPKAIIQTLLLGTRIVGRAFRDAYKQASINSEAARAAAGNMKATEEGDKMSRSTGITVDESLKILNLEDINNKEDMMKKYEHLFEANDPKKGGSHYLQSKVVRARERIEIHWAQEKLEAEIEAQKKSAEENAQEGIKNDDTAPKNDEAKSTKKSE